MYQSDTFRTAPPKSPRPTQKKFQFYNRPTVHARFQSVSPHQNTLQANCTPPCRCRTRSTGFPSASSSLDPFDTIALPRTHPTPSETTTHPNHPMKRFKKKALNQNHKNLNSTTPSPSFHRPNKKPRK